MHTSSSTIQSPAIEKPEPTFNVQPAAMPAAESQQQQLPTQQAHPPAVVAAAAPKITQLADLEKELAKLHQVRTQIEQQQAIAAKILADGATIKQHQPTAVQPPTTATVQPVQPVTPVQSQQVPPQRKISRFLVNVVAEKATLPPAVSAAGPVQPVTTHQRDDVNIHLQSPIANPMNIAFGAPASGMAGGGTAASAALPMTMPQPIVMPIVQGK